MMLKSFSVKNITLNFFGSTLKKQTPVSLLATAFMLLICPGVIIQDLLSALNHVGYYRTNSYYLSASFFNYTFVIFICTLVVMLILTLLNFGFLYSKKAGDIYHALPLNRNQLLFTRIGAVFTGSFFSMALAYTGLLIINFLPITEGVSVKSCITVFAAMAVLLILCTAFTCLFAVISSGYFNFIITVAAVNIGIPVLYGLSQYWIEDGYGIIIDNAGISYTSPYIYALVKLWRFSYVDINIKSFGILSAVFSLLLSAILILACSLLFKIRKSETAQQAFSFKFVNIITTVFVSVCIGSLVGLVFSLGEIGTLPFWIFFTLGSLLASIATGAIVHKNFKTVKISLLNGAVAVAVALSVFVASVIYTAHAEMFIPDASSIESITVNDTLVMQEDIETVLDIHECALKTRNKISSFKDSYSFYYRIDYVLKGGRTVSRGYDIYVSTVNLAYLKSDTYLNIFENPTVPDDTSIHLWDGEKDYDYTLSMLEYKYLLKAYARDIRNAEDIDFSETPIMISGFIFPKSSGGYGSINIYSNFSETFAVLEEIKTNPQVIY